MPIRYLEVPKAEVYAYLQQWAEAVTAEAQEEALQEALRRPPAPTVWQLVEQARRSAEIDRRWREAIRAERARRPPPSPPPPPEEVERRRARYEARRAAYEARRRSLTGHAVPTRLVHRLATAGFSTPDEVRWASDATLLDCYYVGPRTLQAIRAVYPHTPRAAPDWLVEQ